MQRHRFYAPPSQIAGPHITLDPDESHHLTRVLRLAPGAPAFAFDGEGNESECEVARVGKGAAELRVVARLGGEVESPLELTLGQALVKGDKFDWVVQKAVELGVTRVVPLAAEHSEIRKAAGRELRLPRWRRVALEATKQCGRRRLVEITEAESFEKFCATREVDLRVILSERGGRGLRELAAARENVISVALAVAPEGGWSDEELRTAEAHGLTPVFLGPRTLRTETAAIAAVALIQHLFGDVR
jgi:16S rRNA (uracil1498-N3)-methyltransferase